MKQNKNIQPAKFYVVANNIQFFNCLLPKLSSLFYTVILVNLKHCTLQMYVGLCSTIVSLPRTDGSSQGFVWPAVPSWST